jgi:hypothetical protein
MKQLTYTGFIKEDSYEDNDYALFIGESKAPIAEILEEEINEKQVSVRYWISNVERTKEELQEAHLRTLYGVIHSMYHCAYSDYTGYLWTTEGLMIGGHDLMSELKSSRGKFIWLEIDVH